MGLSLKGIDKVKHYYFSENTRGSPDAFEASSIVEEAWVFAIPRESVVSTPSSHLRAPLKHIPVLRDILAFLQYRFLQSVYPHCIWLVWSPLESCLLNTNYTPWGTITVHSNVSPDRALLVQNTEAGDHLSPSSHYVCSGA